MKKEAVNTARKVFNGSNIHITTDGHCYLGVIGSDANFTTKGTRLDFWPQSVEHYC